MIISRRFSYVESGKSTQHLITFESMNLDSNFLNKRNWFDKLLSLNQQRRSCDHRCTVWCFKYYPHFCEISLNFLQTIWRNKCWRKICQACHFLHSIISSLSIRCVSQSYERRKYEGHELRFDINNNWVEIIFLRKDELLLVRITTLIMYLHQPQITDLFLKFLCGSTIRSSQRLIIIGHWSEVVTNMQHYWEQWRNMTHVILVPVLLPAIHPLVVFVKFVADRADVLYHEIVLKIEGK